MTESEEIITPTLPQEMRFVGTIMTIKAIVSSNLEDRVKLEVLGLMLKGVDEKKDPSF